VPAAPPAPSTELDVTLDPAARRIWGHARLRIVNDRPDAIAGVGFWLYPNGLARRTRALTDINFHWLYPGGFSPGGIDVRNVRVDGRPAALDHGEREEVRPTLGERTGAWLPLPAPLPPGGAVTVDLDFDTRIPRRFGAFGCDGPRCRLMGGFYPVPARDAGPAHARRPDEPQFGRAGRTRMTLRLPAGLAAVVGGQPIVHQRDEPIVVEADDALYPTIVTDRVLRPATDSVGAHAVRYLHRAPRPPPSDNHALPYVREDVAGLVLAIARRSLQFMDALLPPGSPARAQPLTLVEAPLRHELVQVHDDVVLVSDQIFRIFPFDRLRKFHRMELARAIFTVIADAAVRAHERAADRQRTPGVLAAHLVEVFTAAQLDKLEYAADILRPLDFMASVDQLLYAPRLASSQTYFGDIGDVDALRDGIARWCAVGAPPRLLYNKLADLLGPAGFAAVVKRTLADRVPLRQAAVEVFGADLGWFWSTWLGVWPVRVNYRLESVKVAPAGAGSHVTVEVRREGGVIREPVEVRIDDRAGGTRTLRWDDAADRHVFDVELPAGLASVEVDPRRRLVESAVGSLRASDDPRYDNRRPARIRSVYQGLGALFDLSNLAARIGAALLFKPQHDLRHQLLATVFHTEQARIGAGATYGWSFGRQADRNNLVSSLYGGLAGARLDPTFGVPFGQPEQPGWRGSGKVGFAHDTRDFLFDPWHAVGLGLSFGYSLTALDDGRRFSSASAGIEALRLFELAPGHVLALAAEAAMVLGDVRLANQLMAAGGPASVRGYDADELLSRAHAIGRIQLRNDYVSGLDWNLLHWTSVRGFAGTLFADVAAIATCDSVALSRDRVFFDAGYSFRVLHDAFGVYQQLLSIDVALPLNRHAPYASCLGQPVTPVERPAFKLLISFFPSF
jgi:hypothetical protein